MVNNIHIKNFKSVYDLQLDLGRFNVFIGENGCGKSNILEAVALGSAASANLLGNEFLASRGIRVTESKLMFSAFSNNNHFCDLKFEIDTNQYNYHPRINNENNGIEEIYREGSNVHVAAHLAKELLQKEERDFGSFTKEEKQTLGGSLRAISGEGSNEIAEKTISFFADFLDKTFSNPVLSKYLIFSPENNSLRNFFDERQISPIGLKGEGLFKELKRISLKKSKKQFAEINNYLRELLDWFEKFELSKNGFPGEQYLKIKDKYLSESVEFIDQRSANEGLLFLLFFVTLFISENTPSFFAIDNIENSFNPKLCSKLVEILVKLSKEHKKQALITTHNPFILDGLDLGDDEQRLFVVRRNLDGHTFATRVKPDKPLSYKLSEAWMNGYIGGLPNNF